MKTDPFKEYIKASEPSKAIKGYAWSTAIGLQAVDGLKTSKYLIDKAIDNIEGKISIKEAQNLIDAYYEEKTEHSVDEERTEEADKVSARIAELLSETAFSFSPAEYISIHKKLFNGLYKYAGKIRDYNLTKKEWVLDGASVTYGTASELKATLEYDFEQERNFSYKGLSMDETIHHLAVFVSRLWQIHIFGEGNTRTTAVFFIKYLRTLGFSVTNDIFADNSWYFRNSLVRANYTNIQNNVHETTKYLEIFLRNLLLNEKNELHNRSMHISGLWDDNLNFKDENSYIKEAELYNQSINSYIENKEMDIKNKKTYIDNIENNIKYVFSREIDSFSTKTLNHIQLLFDRFGYDEIFGRSMVMDLLGLKPSASSRLLSNLLDVGIIESVSGHGKGKYKFKNNI